MYLYKTVIAQQNIQSFMRLLDKERALGVSLFHELRWDFFCYTVKHSESLFSKCTRGLRIRELLFASIVICFPISNRHSSRISFREEIAIEYNNPTGLKCETRWRCLHTKWSIHQHIFRLMHHYLLLMHVDEKKIVFVIWCNITFILSDTP